MVTPHEAEINLDAYGRIVVALARAGVRRGAVLEAHGLCEARWQAIDDAWQARLSDAMEETDAQVSDAVPALLADYARAIERAHSDDSQVMAFERFLEATRAARAGGELGKTLGRLGFSVDDYLRASRHYTRAMTEDGALAERFRRALG